MTAQRALLKRAALGLLDAVAEEHPLGLQTSKAARFIMVSDDGARVEIMFEKHDDSPPNLWCLERAAGPSIIAARDPRRSPASGLWTKRGKDGELLYGRHSALKEMPQLGEADLVCFTPETVAEIGQIIDRLSRVSRDDLS